MMDASPLFAVPFHPIRQTVRRDFKGPAEASYTRTERPVKYYIIDFGLSIRYDSVDPPPSEVPVLGGDKSVPEFKGDDPSKRYGGLSKPYNPFPTDVYCLGNWIREDFLDVSFPPPTRSPPLPDANIGLPQREDGRSHPLQETRLRVPSPARRRHDAGGPFRTPEHGPSRRTL